jgi:hypothetical protein
MQYVFRVRNGRSRACLKNGKKFAIIHPFNDQNLMGARRIGRVRSGNSTLRFYANDANVLMRAGNGRSRGRSMTVGLRMTRKRVQNLSLLRMPPGF